MSALAVFLKKEGNDVSGSDSNPENHILYENGISVFNKANLKKIEECDVVTFSSAIKEDNEDLKYAKHLGKKILSRGELLGEISKKYKNVIAVAGSHGKTTTTALIYNVLKMAGKNPTLHLGGILKEENTNFVIGDKEYFVTEACEYCDNFLFLKPTISVVTNIEPEHLDYFKTFENVKKAFVKFANILPEDGYLVTNGDDKSCLELLNEISKNIKVYTFAIDNENANFVAKNIVYDKDGFAKFDVYFNNEKYGNFELAIPGKHNVLNALACIALCEMYNISKESVKVALKKFHGANRRFEYKGELNGAKIYDDYAHHPTEIKATVKAMKCKKYNKSWGVFQSHTYSRTFNLLDGFVEALEDFDNIIIADIYAAREENTYNIYPEDIVNKLKEKGKNAIYIGKYEDIAEYLRKNIKKDDLVLTVGAGPVVKVAEMLTQN